MNERKKWEAMTLEERRDLLAEGVPHVLEGFEKKRPAWLEEGILGFIRAAIENLRHYADEVTEDAVSTPFVELHYPVAWDWEIRRPGPAPVRDADLETPEAASARMAEGFVEAFHLEILKLLTKGAAVHIKDGVELPLIAPEVQERVEKMTEEEREVFFSDFGEPFVLGGTYFTEDVDFEVPDGPDEDEPRPLTAAGVKRLEEVERFLPFAMTNADTGEPVLNGSVVLAVHPLVVNEDERSAFYPVEVGLNLRTHESTMVEDIGTLPPEVRKTLWEELLKALDLAEKELPKRRATTPTTPEREVSDATAEPAGEEARAEVGAPAVVVPPAPIVKTRVMKDGSTLVSRETALLTKNVGRMALPKKWSSVPRWADLEAEERDRLVDTYGEAAFRRMGGNPPLMKRETDREGKELVSLTREAEARLEDRVGVKGYRRLLRDEDKVPREYLVRRFPFAGGHVEVRVSWYNAAWPLHEDAVNQASKDLEALLARLKEQPALFEDLNAPELEAVENKLRNLVHIRDGKVVMEAVSRKFGLDGRNPVTMPVYELKALLRCHGADDAMDRVRGCLRALQEVRYTLKVSGGTGPSYTKFGPFLASVREEKKGAGKHTEGDFSLEVSRDFIGCLEVFREREDRLLKGRSVVLYDFRKKLSVEERKDLSFIQGFSRLAPHYDTAQDFTNEQKNLRGWLEREVTRRKDPAPKGRKKVQVKPTASDADEPRLYGNDFCPLIPEGRLLAGALGHFRRAPEAGRTLGGTTGKSTATGGAHEGGLLEALNYYYPPGAAHETRHAIVRDALQDIVRVVEAFEGVVAARRPDGTWLTVEDAAALPEDELVKKTKWFLFVTPDLGGHMARTVEDHINALADQGHISHRVRVERPPRPVPGAPAPTHRVGLDGEALWVRLHATRRTRNLSQAQVAALFGVTRQALGFWEAGEERGKPIPAELEGLVHRWVETGQAPSAEELASRRNRRTGVNPETGKPRKPSSEKPPEAS